MTESKNQNVIGRRIFRQSLVIALIMIFVLSSVQVWLDYRNLMGSIQSTFEQIKAVQVNGLATALWNYSSPELETISAGIINYPYISYSEISERGEIIESAGQKLNRDFIEEKIPLVYNNNGELENVGLLTVQANIFELYQSVLINISRTLLIQAVFVFVLTFIFLVLIDKQITQYLHRAVGFLQTYDISNLEVPFDINKRASNDEIDLLVQAVNTLRHRLSLSNNLKDETERKHSTLLGNLPGMAYRCKNDRNWTMELVSAGCYDLTGYQPEEIIKNNSLSYEDLILPEDRDFVRDTVQSQIKERLSFEIYYRIKTKANQVRWVWEKGVGVFSENHELTAIEGFISDITERKQQERELEAIASVSFALRSVETRDRILSVILEQTTNLLNTDGCLVELIDQETGDSVVEVANGFYQSMVGFRIPADKGLNSYIRTTGKPYLNNAVFSDPMNLRANVDIGCQASSGVPMIAQEKLIGFLWIGRKLDISEKAVNTLSAIADIAANAIHRVDLFHQTNQRLNQLIGLRKIDNAINNNLELNYTLDLFVDQAIDLLHVDAARLFRYDADSHLITFMAGKGGPSDGKTEPHLLDLNSTTGKAILDMATIQINDIDKFEPSPEARILSKVEGYKSIFATPLVIKNELQGLFLVFLKKPFYPDADWISFFETMAGQAAIAINESTLWKNLQQSNYDLQMSYDDTLKGWSDALDLRDHETEDHTRRVTELSLRLAEAMGLKGEDLSNIRRGALLHDIGKMGVPDNILTKPGKLTAEEWEIMRKHPETAYNLLHQITYLYQALDIPYCHHEKWDGTGYPRGLKGKDIPLAARIFALADVWDAMTSDRYYRAAMSQEEVIEYIQQNKGKHFDPIIAELFLNMDKK